MKELLYTVWLSLSCRPGSATFIKLLNKFGTPKNIYEADGDSLASCIASKTRAYDALMNKDTKRAESILDFCTSKNIGILTYFDSDFPESLKNVKNPPVLLYYKGTLPRFDDELLISVVGARHLSAYGRRNAFKSSYDLASAGAVIVSGMATGIDGVALAAAIAAGRPTVAIIGSGIDVCYPPQHKTLADEIVKNGCIITEYAPGTPPDRYNFPKRNRIISALSSATLVIEGRERSGALITARCALEQGKAVYALPGNVGNINSVASNLLIKNGARLFTSADDIIRDFDRLSPGRLNPFNSLNSSMPDMNGVLRELRISCVSVDDEIFKAPAAECIKQQAEPRVQTAYNRQEASRIEERVSSLFDKNTLDLYKKIPTDSDCSIEQLVGGAHNLRDVMQGLLKLEIASFVTMLPGDRVKRNL